MAYVLFTMTRGGQLLNVRVERSTRFALLDSEALELLQRAQPLPPLPPLPADQPGDDIVLVVPVQFFMRR